jgi:DNA-binding CsgD family transcriptional regulator
MPCLMYDLCNEKKINIMITNREVEILKLITQRHTSKEIAAMLDISVSTVETHRRHLFQKLGVRNAIGLVQEAIQRKLV